MDAIFRGTYRQRHETKTAHGTAAWASRRDLTRAGLFNAEGLILGRTGRRMLRLRTDRHMLTLAPTRSGKGVSAVIPNLLTWPGSALIIDPKGENTAITARRRREMGQSVYVLDPWGITDEPRARFNPIDLIGNDGGEFADDAALIADAIVAPPVGADESHWVEESKALITGLILYVATSEPPDRTNLGHVRTLLTQGNEGFFALLETMASSPAADGLVARAGNRQLQKEDREFSGVVSTAQAQTHFLDSARLRACLTSSSFDLSQLKHEPMTIYLVLPTKRLHTHARWLRLVIASALDLLASEQTAPPVPVLFMLDEFAALGRLAIIETAMGLLAGYGVELWPIVQDLAQLKDLYPHRWESFVANAHLQTFGTNDPGTADYLERMLGNRTVTVRSENASLDRGGSEQYSRTARPLMTADEIRRMPPDQQILLLQGLRPILARKVRYFEDKAFVGQFDANPFRGGPVGRP
ncbi:type IV secretory system conjugative DNA transfer family protein [Telmatospirillum sp.]|uniref:type IV secretory system conjugative DNA transfer family protein n=1 Tax=Telmatospirillum sp. TaxID=2079197 RepID=UPI0028475542|nr:type IV secretory system conjugative DNA transfer family protein [Telmatospirillum sp.]MDR3440579.1 type IV secretory system conjugative DNA transfer family protein [Telmatospirillum sp.]